mgnify:CR=1 FL=1
MNKKIFAVLALLFIISCTSIQNTGSDALQKAKDLNVKLFDKLDNLTGGIESKANCQYIFNGDSVPIVYDTSQDYYIIYGDSNTRADYPIWQNLVNNKVIVITQDNETFTITNLQPNPIKLCKLSTTTT